MKQKTIYSTGLSEKLSRKIFVTSDTFFGRKKSAKDRGFKSTHEMNEALIEKWNEKISDSDQVIHLGNFAWSVDDIERIYPRLNGDIYFMIGEHDQSLVEISEIHADVKIIEQQIVMKSDVVLCHWPLQEWPGKKLNKFHFHGHLASNIKSNVKDIKRLNVCCDNWHLEPVEISETLEILKDFS
jgi:calcineurin-like phosphoesterase family protein